LPEWQAGWQAAAAGSDRHPFLNPKPAQVRHAACLLAEEAFSNRRDMTAFTNNLKTALLLGLLTGILVAVGGMLGKQFLLPFLFIAILMNVGAWFFSDRIAIATMQCREVDTDHDLYRLVDDLRQRAGLPMPRVYVSPHEAPNAFATGRSPSHAAVAVTDGALRLLNREELTGVIGHELAHVKNRDTLTSTVAAVVAGVLAYVAQASLWFGGMGGRGRGGGNPLVALLTVITAALGAALLKAAISRSREYVADHDGAKIAGSPRGLVNALQKLEHYAGRIPLNQPNPAMNNMFIIEPFTGGGVLQLFATHPPTDKRIAALMRG
jgi:heat shock protein HtpX